MTFHIKEFCLISCNFFFETWLRVFLQLPPSMEVNLLPITTTLPLPPPPLCIRECNSHSSTSSYNIQKSFKRIRQILKWWKGFNERETGWRKYMCWENQLQLIYGQKGSRSEYMNFCEYCIWSFFSLMMDSCGTVVGQNVRIGTRTQHLADIRRILHKIRKMLKNWKVKWHLAHKNIRKL